MKNLKKVLSLVLALAMAMSLMTAAFAADTDFADADKINNTEAVEVMAALGVLQGNNGEFDPQGNLTRETAAKIICYMLLGEEAAEELTVSGAPFDDVKADRWSAPFIAYCAEKGIITGNGAGKFYPTAELTGLQFAKMCLVALGYSAANENMTGDAWGINTSALAVSAGLNKNLGSLTNTTMTREAAAQMAFNMLKATLVQYTGGTEIVLPDGTKISAGATRSEVSEYGYTNYDKTGDTAYAQFVEKYFPDLTKQSASNDDFGRPAEYKWMLKGESDAVYTVTKTPDHILVLDDNYVGTNVDTTITKLEDFAKDELKNNKLNFNTVTETWFNGAYGGVAAKYTEAKTGAVAELFVNEDDSNNVETVVAYQYDIVKVDKVTTLKANDTLAKDYGATVKYTLDGAQGSKVYVDTLSDEKAGTQAIGTYAKGDVLVVVQKADGTLLYKSIAETVEGAVTAYTADSYTIGGTKYVESGAVNDVVNGSVDFDKGIYKLYLDPNGYILETETVEGDVKADLSDIVLVTAAATKGTNNEGDEVYYVKTVAMDGTYKVYQTAVNPSVSANTLYMIDTNDDDEYIFTAAAQNKKLTESLAYIDNDNKEYFAVTTLKAATDFKVDTKSVTTNAFNGQKVYLTNDTVYLFADGSKSTVTVGGITKANIAANTQILTSKTSDGAYEAEVVILSGSYSAAVSGDVLYVKGEDTPAGYNANGKEFTAYDLTGEKVMITLEKATTTTAGFYEYTVDAKGVYTLNAIATGSSNEDGQYTVTNGTATKYGTMLTVGDISDLEAKDAVIVDLTEDELVNSLNDLTDTDIVKTGKLNACIYVDDDAVVAIIVTGIK